MKPDSELIMSTLIECESIVKRFILPDFSINDVKISFNKAKSTGGFRKLTFDWFVINPEMPEYEHLERKPDLSTKGVRFEHWIAAHELSHVICFELECQSGIYSHSLLEHSNLDEQSTWESNHRALLEAARYWYRKWGNGRGFFTTSPVSTIVTKILGEKRTEESFQFLYNLLLNHANWEFDSGARLGKQISHGPCFEAIYKLLRHEVVNPKYGINAPMTPTSLVKYRKPYLKKYLDRHR